MGYKISGLSEATLLKNTGKALRQLTGSDVSAAKVRQFITAQFQLRNEHCISGLLSAAAPALPKNKLPQTLSQAQMLDSLSYHKNPAGYLDSKHIQFKKLLHGGMARTLLEAYPLAPELLVKLCRRIDLCMDDFSVGIADALRYSVAVGFGSDTADRSLHEVRLQLKSPGFSFSARTLFIEFNELDGVSFAPAQNFLLNDPFHCQFNINDQAFGCYSEFQSALHGDDLLAADFFQRTCLDCLVQFGQAYLEGNCGDVYVFAEDEPEFMNTKKSQQDF